MLRAAQKNNIIKTINNSNIFDFYDFEFKESGNEVTIKYLHSKKYFSFHFIIPKEETYRRISNTEKKGFWFTGTMYPGRVSSSESFNLEGINKVCEQIELWLKELDMEIIDLHVQKKLINTEEKVNELFGKINEMTEEMEDTLFTKEEAQDLKEKLDNMEKSIIENLEKIITDKVNLEKEISYLKKEIDKLKNSTERISKKSWTKKCLYKMGEWSINPEKRKLFLGGLKFLGGVTKLMGIEGNIDKDIIDLFPDSVQEVIPDNLVQSDK